MTVIVSVAIVAYIIISLNLAAAYLSEQIAKPPWTVRFASYIEAGTGATLYLLGVLALIAKAPLTHRLLSFFWLNAFGVAWFIIGSQIMKGNKRARKISLLLSILRIFTIIGALPSIASIYLLNFSKSSKQFFQNSIAPVDEFTSPSIDTTSDESILGQKAVCLTDLKPIGKIIIDGQVFQGISCASFIEKGTEVQILEKKNHEYVVKPC